MTKKRLVYLAVMIVLMIAVVTFLTSCGGSLSGTGGGPIVTLSKIDVTASSQTVMVGNTLQLIATGTYSDGSTAVLTSSAIWNSSSSTVASVNIGVLKGLAPGTVTASASSGSVTGTSPMITVNAPQPLNVQFVQPPVQVDTGTIAMFNIAITGGDGSNTVQAWTVNGTAGGNATVGTITNGGVYTAPSLQPMPNNIVTIAITVTEGTASSSASTEVTVVRTIGLSFDPRVLMPNNEIYPPIGGSQIGLLFACTGCEAGDTYHVLSTYGAEQVTTFTQPMTTIQTNFNLSGLGNVPGPIKVWIVGSDNAQSPVLQMVYRSHRPAARQGKITGEIYYFYSGNGTLNAQGCSSSILKYKSDNSEDGNIPCIGSNNSSGSGFDVDEFTVGGTTTRYLIVADQFTGNQGGLSIYNLDNLTMVNGYPIPTHGVVLGNTPVDAVTANNGTVCALEPSGILSCVNESTLAVTVAANLNNPMDVVMPDATHVVVYCAGDNTVRWFDISAGGANATPTGVATLTTLTPTSDSRWASYLFTGGQYVSMVGNTLGVMGETINADGSVSQTLALVSNASQAVLSYVTLPAGSVLITPDPAHGAFIATYPDLSGTALSRSAKIDADTGTMTNLQQTSPLAPAAGILVTQGGQLDTFVQGKINSTPNQ